MMEYAPADGKMGVTLLLKNLPFHFLWSEKKIPVILEFILCVNKIQKQNHIFRSRRGPHILGNNLNKLAFFRMLNHDCDIHSKLQKNHDSKF